MPRPGEYIWDADAPELPKQFLEQLEKLGKAGTEDQVWQIADSAVAVLADLRDEDRAIVIRIMADFERWLRIAEAERDSTGGA